MFFFCSEGESKMNMLAPLAPEPSARPAPRSAAVEAVEAVLALPEEELDYARAKVALDAIVDPGADIEWTMAELARLTETARALAGDAPSELETLRAVRVLLYEPGAWNDFRPYAYDMSDPEGTHLPNKLLHNYLRNRLGQCVSMPILFLILGDRLGLDLSLASSPDHFFVRFAAPDGRVWNLETTSGALPARTDWYRENGPISDRALETGFYMRSLPRREAVAMMAIIVVEHLYKAQCWSEASGVCEPILAICPRSCALVMAAEVYGRMHMAEFEERYPIPFLIPEHARARKLMLMRNNSLYAAAERLGWQPDAEPL
jgi:regulator of sirC expression with transglutaminase-like and TPR domain